MTAELKLLFSKLNVAGPTTEGPDTVGTVTPDDPVIPEVEGTAMICYHCLCVFGRVKSCKSYASTRLYLSYWQLSRIHEHVCTF